MTGSTTPGKLHEKTVVITGAARGIGAATAMRLAEHGATVVITDLDVRGVDTTALPSSGGQLHHTVRHDVTSEASWQDLVDYISSHLGTLDGLVNNAGVGTAAPIEDESMETWNRSMAVNATGMWLGMKHLGPLLVTKGAGSIVNMSSILGIVGGFGVSAAYHAGKGAIRSVTKNAAVRWAPHGVRVNSVHPGYIATDAVKAIFHEGDGLDRLLAATPMGRLGTEREVADAVAFLISDESTFITGTEIVIDGGWTAQ